MAECKAGRRSSRKCAFSKLSLGKQSLILRYIPLVCNQDYIIPNPVHFICSAVKPGCFAKNHMPLKTPLCHNAENDQKKNLCVCSHILPLSCLPNRRFSREPFVFLFVCQHIKTFPRQLVLIEVQLKRDGNELRL